MELNAALERGSECSSLIIKGIRHCIRKCQTPITRSNRECKWPNWSPCSFCFLKDCFLIFPMFTAAGLSQTPVIALRFKFLIVLLLIHSARCHEACVRSFKYRLLPWESGTCSYPQPGFPSVNNMFAALSCLSHPLTPCTPVSCKRASLRWKSKQKDSRTNID